MNSGLNDRVTGVIFPEGEKRIGGFHRVLAGAYFIPLLILVDSAPEGWRGI